MTSSAVGTWWLPSDKTVFATGHLEWEPLRSPRLTLLNAPADLLPGHGPQRAVGFGFPDESVPMIHGRAAGIGRVTVLECRYGGMQIGSTQTHDLVATYVLFGVWLDAPEEPWIRRVEVELPAAEGLLGPRPTQVLRRPSNRSRSIQLSLDSRVHRWSADGVDIELGYDWHTTTSNTSTTVRMKPVLKLTSGKPRSLDFWIHDWIAPINGLVQVAVGSKSNPRLIRLWQRKNARQIERAQTEVKLHARGVGDHEFQLDHRNVLIRLGAVDLNPGGMPDVVRRAQVLEVEQSVFLSLLSDVITSSERPLHNRYLDIMGGLEAYDSHERGTGPLPSESFADTRRSLLGRLGALGLAADEMKFVERWLSRRSFFSLEQRIRHLARGVDLLEGWKLTPQAMAGVRNQIAHGDGNIDGADLQQAFEQALDLARRLVFRDLGILRNAE